MYSVTVVLAIAVLFEDRQSVRYALPLSVMGGCMALYHVFIQEIPGLYQLTPCHIGVPCNVDRLHLFGFVTTPLLSLLACLWVAAWTSVVAWWTKAKAGPARVILLPQARGWTR